MGPGPGSDRLTNPALSTGLQGILAGNGGGLLFFQTLIPNLVTLFLIVGSAIFVFMLLSGGVAWITSGGDKVAVENARARVTHALIGLVVLFSVFAIVKLVEIIFGTSILQLDIGALNL
jgi:hypothetical protein